MFHQVKTIATRGRGTLAQDAAGVLALFAVLGLFLHLTSL